MSSSGARLAHDFRLAREARERLKHRLDGGHEEDGAHEKQVKDKLFRSFDFGKIESEYHYAKRTSEHTGQEIEELLGVFQVMCHMATIPSMRSPDIEKIGSGKKSYPDVFSIASRTIKENKELKPLAPAIQELLKLFHHSYGMFVLDFEKFNNAIIPMIENIEDYVHAKEMDEDVRAKHDKLKKIESLIAFIEAVALVLKDDKDYTYPKFSSLVTTLIGQKASAWEQIAEELLRMKVMAEADLSTQIS